MRSSDSSPKADELSRAVRPWFDVLPKDLGCGVVIVLRAMCRSLARSTATSARARAGTCACRLAVPSLRLLSRGDRHEFTDNRGRGAVVFLHFVAVDIR